MKERHMKTALRRHQMFIGGQWADSTGSELQDVKNPALGEVIATVPKGTAEDVDRAVKAARKAYDEVWFDSTPRERSEMLLKMATSSRGSSPRTWASRWASPSARRSRPSPTASASSRALLARSRAALPAST